MRLQTQTQTVPAFPLPDQEQAMALQIASDYLTQAGTQAATRLLGSPRLNGETTLLAEFSQSMLSGAALCAELVAIVNQNETD